MQFHVNRIEPAVEFEADLLKPRALTEAVLLVKPQAGDLLGVDHGNHCVHPAGSRKRDQFRQQLLANSLALRIRSNVD
jgi:hypothetical protein